MINNSIVTLLWLFVVYAFLGWCLEVVYATVHTGKFVNRGFLNGPYCPIYGVGMIIVLTILEPIKVNLPVFFVGAVVLTTLLELTTGFVLERIFNQKWWDYADEPYNLGGYVCLGQSLVWGVAAIFVVYILQPFIGDFIKLMSGNLGVALLIFILVAFIADVAVTVIVLSKVKYYNRVLDEIGDKIKALSNSVGKNISDGAISAMKLGDKNKQELDNLKDKYQAIINKKILGYRRLTKAFPGLNLFKTKRVKDK